MKVRLLFSLLIVSLLAGSVLGATSAFFSDTETSTGNVLQAGSFDLLINGQNNPIGIVSVDDLKPGDNYIATKSVKLVTNPGRVWLYLKDLQNGQGTETKPEILEEEELGEPKSDIENYITYDLKVGDNVIIDLEDETLLPDAVSCWIPLGVLPGNEEVKIEQSFHFDSSVTNWAQGDMLTFKEEFWAVQDRNNNLEPPDTGSGRIWNNDKKRCEGAPELLEILQVSASTNESITSDTITEVGKNYQIKAIGTAFAGDTINFDAKYSHTNRISEDTWTDLVSGYESWGTTLLELKVNDDFVDWGNPYNPVHEYTYDIVGDGGPLSFVIYDIYYPNNTGSLTVEIYELP